MATWSFSLQLLKKDIPADENQEKDTWRVLRTYEESWNFGSTQWRPTQFTWISPFLFLFPRALEPEMLFRIICQGSRRQTPPESPSFFSSSSFNNLALRLFPFPDISGTYSSSLLLRTKTKDREGWAYDDGNASALNFCALMLQDGKGFNFTAGRSCMPSVYPQMDGTFYWARGGTGMPWYSRPLRPAVLVRQIIIDRRNAAKAVRSDDPVELNVRSIQILTLDIVSMLLRAFVSIFLQQNWNPSRSTRQEWPHHVVSQRVRVRNSWPHGDSTQTAVH